MVNAVATALAAAYCGSNAVDAIFGGTERPIVAGMLGPGGKSRRVPGGYDGSGKYSFGSACAHANWLTAGMFVSDEGGQRMIAPGQPEVRVCFIPRSRLEINANWNVLGLQGTGSFDYEVPSQFVGEDFTMERTESQPRRGRAHFRFGVAGMGCAGHTAIVLGIMKRALKEISRIASEKRRPGYESVIAAHPVFKEQFARHEAQYQAAHALAFRVFTEAQAVAAAGSNLEAYRPRFRQVITWTHQLTTEIVHFAYSWAGQEAFRNPSALGRCMRDALVAQQHVYVDPITLVDVGTELIKQWSAPEALRA
jgi:alkylation response protein AidB-like acyl-CoA dehydrogenase